MSGVSVQSSRSEDLALLPAVMGVSVALSVVAFLVCGAGALASSYSAANWHRLLAQPGAAPPSIDMSEHSEQPRTDAFTPGEVHVEGGLGDPVGPGSSVLRALSTEPPGLKPVQ
jgi:hypothetical protein